VLGVSELQAYKKQSRQTRHFQRLLFFILLLHL
jgi:hypothetical protein